MIDSPWLFAFGLASLVVGGSGVGQMLFEQNAPGSGGFLFMLFCMLLLAGICLVAISFEAKLRPDQLDEASKQKLQRMLDSTINDSSEK
ncbi:MAG: hypothetical protein AAF333_18815 [Planctomycetota bacterium]